MSVVNDGLAIYFGTSTVSQKARNLARDGRVSATVTLPYRTWDEIRGLSLAPRTERVTDLLEIEDVVALMLQKFANLGTYVRDDAIDELAVCRLRPVVFSILDYSNGFGWTGQVEV